MFSFNYQYWKLLQKHSLIYYIKRRSKNQGCVVEEIISSISKHVISPLLLYTD